MPGNVKIMIVDDDHNNLELIEGFLLQERYHVIKAHGGQEALRHLEEQGTQIKAILLDWMMHPMDGLECLKIIKSRSEFLKIPVIMQTAKSTSQDILTAIRAGACYYLPKPFSSRELYRILQIAVNDFLQYEELTEQIQQGIQLAGLLEEALFRFRTISEARSLAQWLANAFPVPGNAMMGLCELFLNAVEHGNLGITYDEKTILMEANQMDEEIERRLQLPEYKHRTVEVQLRKTAETLAIRIKDQGQGFDYQNYLAFNDVSISNNHGRGIFMTMWYFDLKYLGCGNEVEATFRLQPLLQIPD